MTEKWWRERVERGRIEVFRHILRGVALSSAVGMPEVGCAESHLFEPGTTNVDGGRGARDADVNVADAARDLSVRDAGRDLFVRDLSSDVGGPDLARFDLGSGAFRPACFGDTEAADLTGIRLPDGIDGIAVFAAQWQIDYRAPRTIYVAGDYAAADGSLPGPRSMTYQEDGAYVVWARRGSNYGEVSLDEVVSDTVESAQEASLALLRELVHVSCTEGVPGGVVESDTGYVGVGTTLPCHPDGLSWDRYTVSFEVTREGAVSTGDNTYLDGMGCWVLVGRLTGDGLGRMGRHRPTDGSRETTDLGEYFARSAYLEAAAVDAFVRLAAELRAHGAPPELVAWAETSAEDERRHARALASLAESHGAHVTFDAPRAHPVRPLFEVALENAREGCVRETLGATLGHYQAVCATDPRVTSAFTLIADDETSHAALAWAVDAWAASRVRPWERAAVAQARADAIAALDAGRVVSSFGGTTEARRQAGLPEARVVDAMITGLRASVWA